MQYSIRKARGFKTDAENLAHEIRREMGLPTHSRIMAKQIAELFGAKVMVPRDLDIGNETLEELEGPSVKRWSAFVIPFKSPKIRHRLVHNPLHHEHRQEANILHEMGHLICGHEPKSMTMMGSIPIRNFDKTDEDQANYLGYALQLPKDALFHALRNGWSEDRISTEYFASLEAVRLRLNITGSKRIWNRHMAKQVRSR